MLALIVKLSQILNFLKKSESEKPKNEIMDLPKVEDNIIVVVNKDYTIEDYLMGRILFNELSQEYKDNTLKLLEKVNKLMYSFYSFYPEEKKRILSSGYRTPQINASVKGSINSNHMKCAAIDILDQDNKLKNWIKSNFKLIEELQLYVEDFNYTKNWVHLQIVKTKRNPFIP
jgi:uncharacterized protein YcbK (DUF882 family)